MTIIMTEDPNRINGFMGAKIIYKTPVSGGFTNLLRILYTSLLLKSFPIVEAQYIYVIVSPNHFCHENL
jgi:hypothetical protein